MNDSDWLQALQAAKSIQREAKEQGLVLTNKPGSDNLRIAPESANQSLDETVLFDLLITEMYLRDTTRQLFIDGHYALAVEEAYKCLNNLVKSRSGLTADGASLMRSAFSVNNPVLRLNELKTQSQRDQQQGYMDIFAGCMTGIRNPRAHEHRYLDEARIALEMLMLANHLLRLVNAAKRPRRTRTQSNAP